MAVFIPVPFSVPWNLQRSVCFCLLSSPVIVYMCMHMHAYHDVCVCMSLMNWNVFLDHSPPYKLRQVLLVEPRITPSDSLAAQAVPDSSLWVLGIQMDHYPPVVFVGFGDPHSAPHACWAISPTLLIFHLTLSDLSVCLPSVRPSIHLSFPEKRFLCSLYCLGTHSVD